MNDVAIGELRAQVSGTVLTSSDDGWEAARAGWNLAAPRHPALIVLPTNAADVAATVRFARRQHLRVAPQCSGHNAGSLGPLDDAVLISTARMVSVAVDPVARTVRVDAGTRWGAVSAAADAHGLFAPCGSSPDVGVIGYTLGGGLSWLGRELGVAANHVTAIDVVTPDGAHHTATAATAPDLFWALRGGGANFGVVTAMEFGLFAFRRVTAGMFVWPYARRREVLRRWIQWTRTTPDEITTALRIMHFPATPDLPGFLSGQSVVIVDGAVTGEHPEDALAELRALAPHVDTWAAATPTTLNHLHLDPPGPTAAIGTTMLLHDLEAAAVEAFADTTAPGGPVMFVELRQLGGALSHSPVGGGAIGSIPGAFALTAVGLGDDPTGIEPALTALTTTMAPHGTGKVFANFYERPTTENLFYGDTDYHRLQHLRATIDPHGLMLAGHPITSTAPPIPDDDQVRNDVVGDTI